MRCQATLQRSLRNIIKSIGNYPAIPSGQAVFRTHDLHSSSLRSTVADQSGGRPYSTSSIVGDKTIEGANPRLHHPKEPPARHDELRLKDDGETQRTEQDAHATSTGNIEVPVEKSQDACSVGYAPKAASDRQSKDDTADDTGSGTIPQIRRLLSTAKSGRSTADDATRKALSSGSDGEADVSKHLAPGAQLDDAQQSSAFGTTPSGNAFDEIIASAAHRPKDGTVPRHAQMLPRIHHLQRYSDKIQQLVEYRTHHEATRYKHQAERHNYPGVLDWRDVLTKLDNHTPPGEGRYLKKLEIVRLPPGVTAVFRGNVGAAVLEIMKRTECHIQMSHETTDTDNPHEFSSIGLLGSTEQNTRALRILPEYVDVRSTGEPDVNKTRQDDYILERDINQSAATQVIEDLEQDDQYQQEQQRLNEYDQLQLDNILGDITKNAKANVMRSVWASDSRSNTPAYHHLLFERPKNMTTLSLSAYMHDLVTALPKLATRKTQKAQPETESPPREIDHVSRVTESIVNVFADPELVKLAVPATVDEALEFFVRYRKFPEVRKVYMSLENGKYDFTASNYRVLLEAAANSGDMHNYRYVLKLMLRENITPTPLIWAMFHKLVSRISPEDAQVVAEAMHRKGLLVDERAAMAVAKNAVRHDLRTHLASGGTLPQFFDLYNNRFHSTYGLSGFNWLTRGVMNSMIRVLHMADRPSDAFEVLETFTKMEKGGSRFAVDTFTLNLFLAPALAAKDPKAAIAALRHFHVGLPGATIPDQYTWITIFRIAEGRKCFNMFRVAWRYACAAGKVKYRMRTTILRSLLKYTPPDAGTMRGLKMRDVLWHCWAGKFAIGVADGLRHGRHERSSNDLLASSDLEADELNGVASSASTHANQSSMQGNIPSTMQDTKKVYKYRPLSDAAILAAPMSELSSHEKYMMHAAAQTEPGLGREAEERYSSMKGGLEADLSEVGNSQPERPLSEILEEAWQKDMEWEQPGGPTYLGHVEGRFETMMEEGIKVPMRPGDFAKRTRWKEAPWILDKYLRNKGLID